MPTPRARSRTLRFKVLMLVVLVVIVAWSVLWFVAATVVDRHAEKAQHAAIASGAIAHCVNRKVTGFPFRIEIRCKDGSRAGNQDASITFGGLTATALIYQPQRIIAEVRGPVEIEADRLLPISANWDLAHASARVDLNGRAMERLDGEIVDGTLNIGDLPPIAYDELDLNLRANPDDPSALDLALRFDDVVLIPGSDPASLSLRGAVSAAGTLLSGNPNAFLAAMQAGDVIATIDAASIDVGDLKVAATGELDLAPDGTLNGIIDVAIAGYEAELPYVTVVSPKAGETVSALLTNVLMFAPTAMIGDTEAKKLTLRIDGGRVMAGLVPLPVQIPPLTLR